MRLTLCTSLTFLAFISLSFADSSQKQNANTLPGRFNAVSCTGKGSTSFCVGAGFYSERDERGLLVQSINGGANWGRVNEIHRVPQNVPVSFLTSSCMQSNSSACLVAGYAGDKYYSEPLIARTIDKGRTWVTEIIAGASYGLFKKMSCVGKFPNSFCVAAGWKPNYSGPILAQTRDSGKSWQILSIPDFPNTGSLSATSCTEEGSEVLCVAAGKGEAEPILVQSTDRGTTWSRQRIYLPTAYFDFFNAHCVGGGSKASCTIVGELRPDYKRTLPLVLQTIDGGATWNVKTIKGFPAEMNGSLNDVHCVKDNYHSLCIGVGSQSGERLSEKKPLIVQSIDGGKNWSVKLFQVKFGNGLNELNAISCTNNEPKLFCIAVGVEEANSWQPLIMQTPDSGEKWTKQTLTGLLGVLRGASCTDKGSKAMCTATGYLIDKYDSYPLITHTNDRGNSWWLRSV